MGVPERRAREKKERRGSIVAAAEQVFLVRGLDAATMDEIAAAAEVSKGALYLYFTGKDELYVEVLHGFISRLHGEFDKATADCQTGLQEVEAICRKYVEFASTHGDIFRLAMSWMLAKVPIDPTTESFVRYREQISIAMQRNISAIERGKADGSIRTDLDTQTLARQVWASTMGVLLTDANLEGMRQRLPASVKLSEAAPSYVSLLMDAIASRQGEGRS